MVSLLNAEGPQRARLRSWASALKGEAGFQAQARRTD